MSFCMIEGGIICNKHNDVRDLMDQLSWPKNYGMTQAASTCLFLNPYLISLRGIFNSLPPLYVVTIFPL